MHSFLKSLSSKSKLASSPKNLSAPSITSAASSQSTRCPSPNLSIEQSSSEPDFQIIKDAELQLIYGYVGLYTEIELDILTTSQSINLIAHELKSRALETPLLFSTHALDISTDITHSLIRSFVNNQTEFFQHLPLYSPHNLAALLKWILSRHVNSEDIHGILSWKHYESWQDSEHTLGYPPRHLTTHLMSQLSLPVASLLTCLLDLFASASLHAELNGMTAHKCATLFGSYIFGLEHDQPFEKTYNNWLRYSHATEHLILAHMRDLKAQSPTGKVSLRMEHSIKGYPSIIPPLTAPHPSAKIEKVARFRKIVPYYSPNLIASADTWNIARSKTWDRLKPYPEISAAQYLNHKKAGSSKEPSQLLFSQTFKHLLNIDANLNFLDEEDCDSNITLEGPQRFKSLVEKEWSGFMHRGFQQPDAKKLQFNLEETSNARLKMKRETMDWDFFSSSGFIGRETYKPKELEFNSDIQQSCTTPSVAIPPPHSKKGIKKKLMKTAKSPSVFPYDDTPPFELPPQPIDDSFFEAWADVLVASGWCRDGPKEVSWVLLHCKCKSADHQDFEFRPTPLNPDGRNEDMWTLFEEIVLPEHQPVQSNSSKLSNNKANRRSFLRTIIRKDTRKPSASEKLPSIREVPSNFFPGPSDSLAYRSRAPQSSASRVRQENSSLGSFSANSSPFMSQTSTVGRFRSISKRMQAHGDSSHKNSGEANRHADFDPSGIDLQGTDCEMLSERQQDQFAKWVNVSVAKKGRSLKSSQSLDAVSDFVSFKRNHPNDPSRVYDEPIHYTSHTSTRRDRSSHDSDVTGTSDQDEMVLDDRLSSGTYASNDSSDFTVELFERLVEPCSPSLVPIKNIPGLKLVPSPHRSTYKSLGGTSSLASTPRASEFELPTKPFTSDGEEYYSTNGQQPAVEGRRERDGLTRETLERSQRSERLIPQPGFRGKLHAIAAPSRPIRVALRELDLNSCGTPPPSATRALFKPNDGEDWFESLRPPSLPSTPSTPSNSHHHPITPTSSAHVDPKSRKIANIVDMFENARPESSSHPTPKFAFPSRSASSDTSPIQFSATEL